ncbi:MAG: glycosyltransferase family 39 protein [Candidatus Aenigmarchaeota archaeon]|nr:glycosyltransferase family 39 protein [Candidatus Aenigmarchaeota archaeon]
MFEYSRRNLVLILFAYLVVSSILYINLPMAEDESNIIYVSQKWNEGHIPYKDYSGDSKTPGMYYYTAFLLKFTDSMPILRSSIFLVNILATVFLFMIASNLFDKKKGLLSAMLFLLLLLMPGMNGYFFIVDRLFVMFSLAAVYFFVKQIKNRSIGYILVSGLMAGIALVFKQLAVTLPALFIIFFLCVVVNDAKRPNAFRQRKLAKTTVDSFILLIGIAIPVLIVVFHFAALGGLNSMAYWVVKGVTNQFDAESIIVHPETITSLNHIYQFSVMAPFWISSLIVSLALAVKILRKKVSRNEFFLFLWLLSTMHVMVLLLAFQAGQFAPLAIMTGLFFIDYRKKLGRTKAQKTLVYALIVFMIGLSASVNIYSEYNLQTTRRAFYQQEIDVANYIQSHTAQGENIYVFGYRPSIFLLSDRDPPANAPVLGNFNIQVKNTYENATITVLENQKTNYVIHETLTKPEDAPVLFSYIQKNYDIEATIGRFDVYRRK